ncbi:putative esterase [Tolypothrix tenuis PCC 7101]|uniref:Putative esterase n=1 Tax=Tolypothrix tenuis PCC 7101 TaxID=231146 RepID=A0A1Z4MRS1_9CYAN|nr:alpha/beta hydrolase [Aulosira sp. FACHB-113]BAY96183.1 putative esterase [Tolypothrix tenuis PCC 7101]BAZ73310.1 putative esterase [Aulosira laxa NIES-50]
MLYQNFQTQAELDAQYNPKELGLDTSACMDFYTTNSTQVRQELSCHLNIPFGPTRFEHVDIFPATQPYTPILVFIHGGYWIMASSKDFSFVAKGLVAIGVTVVVINYALCPKVTIDEIVRQNRASIAWIYQNAKNFGGDPNRIYVSGHSAGGHLTAMVMATDWENDYALPHNIIKGGFAISGLFDLMPFPYTWLQPKLQLSWAEVLRNSPIRHIPDKAGSLIITYGSEESSEFQRQSQEFLCAWRAKGLEGEYLPQPGKNHFTVIDGFLESNSPVCKAIKRQMNLTVAEQ